MYRNNTILLCGGGSLGHLAPSVAVAKALVRLDPALRPLFLCAPRFEEMELLRRERFPFETFATPKSPEGFTIRWLTFPFSILQSFLASLFLLSRIRPRLIFSKGGFLGVPVCLAGWLQRIPIVLHESDAVMGRSNRLIAELAKQVCLGFPPPDAVATVNNVSVTGLPVRGEILSGSIDAGRRITGFSGRRLVVMIIGGSQGSKALNEAVRDQIDAILELADIIHLTGLHKEGAGKQHARYFTRPMAFEELPHLYALADIVVSRAGAGVLSELALLKKAVIAVPLPGVAHDHQWANAMRLKQAGALILLPQEQLSELSTSIRSLIEHAEERHSLGERLHVFFPAHAAEAVAKQIKLTMDKG